MNEQRRMKPIWYFVGLALLVMGILVIVADTGPLAAALAKIEKRIYEGKAIKMAASLAKKSAAVKKEMAAAREIMALMSEMDLEKLRKYKTDLEVRIEVENKLGQKQALSAEEQVDSGMRALAAGQEIFAALADQDRIAYILEKYRQGEKSVLYRLRPNLWWGAFMVLFGLVFFVFGRRMKDG